MCIETSLTIQQALIYTHSDKPEAKRGCTVSQGVDESSTARNGDSSIATGIYQTHVQEFNSLEVKAAILPFRVG